MNSDFSTEDIQKISIRFPLFMYEEIKELAHRNDRSINKQVVHLIRETLNKIKQNENNS